MSKTGIFDKTICILAFILRSLFTGNVKGEQEWSFHFFLSFFVFVFVLFS